MHLIILRKKKIFAILVLLFVLLLVLTIAMRLVSRTVPTINPIYIGNTDEKAVSLMVNVDWGDDILPAMLGVFKEKNVKATYFISGRFASKFPELVRQIYGDGHEIGNHGYSHPHADRLSVEANQKEIVSTEEVFKDLGITWSKLFAPPYGEHKEHVVLAAEKLGYKTIMWTLDTVDWKDPAPRTIIDKIVSKADNGALILMHPKKCTLEALPEIIDSLRAKEFTFKVVSEILQ